MLLTGKWEGFTQASELQRLIVTSDHQYLPSVEDQLCRGRVVMLQQSLQLSTGYTRSGVSWMVQAKVYPHLFLPGATLPKAI